LYFIVLGRVLTHRTALL